MPLQTLDRADVKDGFISGVASTPSTDAFGHSVCAGAFDRSIKAKGLGGPKGVKLLAGHDWAKLIGVITRLEDALRIEAQLNLDIGYVRDLHSSIVHNGGLSFSVGFAPEDFGGAVGDEQPDRLLWQQERDASRLPIRHEAEWRAAPLGPTWTSLSRLIEQVKDALVVLNQPLRYVAPLRRMQGIIFRGANKLPEWSAESAHSNRGAFLQSHQYRRRDIRLIERFRICQ